MSVCIICREEKEEFSDEHVIPDAIGGCYHINNVCKHCNSIMGNKIDNKLVNHMFSKHLRFLKKIKGKTGEIPNPFDGTHNLKDDPSRKVQLIPDEKSIIKLYMLPKINNEKIKENEYRISISVDENDITKLDDILCKKMQRLGLNTNQIISKELVESKKKGLTVNIHNSIDLEEYKIGLLKIAYEFAISNIKKYFEDEMAIEISHVLKNAIYNQVTRYVNVGDGFTKDLLIPFADYLDFESDKHYLILLNNNGKLYCLLSIFYQFIVGIQLSNKPYLSDFDIIIGINDYTNKTFNAYSFYDIINNSSRYSYTYAFQFTSQKDKLEFIEETKKDDCPFCSNEGGLLLFDSSGANILSDQKTLLINFYSSRRIGMGEKLMEISVPNGYFVKMKSNKKVIRLLKIIEERTITKI